MTETVYVGLSGGVDSAVSAALLKEQGYDVVGAYIKIWSPEFTECTWQDDRLDAKRIAAHLGIPFEEIDLSREYLDYVVQDMVESYRSGITPNPDILCNRNIKFGAFSKWAFERGAQKVATGHYAQIQRLNNQYALLSANDVSKDQSYFLYRLTQNDLSQTLFPIGHLLKSQVRVEARRFNLPVASKPDSQGLCFVGDITLKDFLRHYITLESGDVLDETGKRIGSHDGAALYTVGQRHGFQLLPHATKGPHFVTRIDTNLNTIWTSRTHADAFTTHAQLSDVHWIGTAPTLPASVSGVVRYHALPATMTVRSDTTYSVVTKEPSLFSIGQSLVFYKNNMCLGGGIISN